MPELRLLTAERTREKLTVAQERHIRKLYREALAEVQEWSKRLEGRDNISSILRRQYLDQMEKELIEAMEHIGSETEKLIRSNISSTATAVVKDANRMLNNMGIGLSTAYSFVPADVVQAITMGKIYDGDWTLSKALWANTKKAQQDIHDIIAKGVLENKSSYDIANDLEKYVNPSAAKPWDWGKIYPGVRKKIDYNAQRLARTLVSHAYQQSFVRTTKDNPFFEGYKWLTSGNHEVCEICRDRATKIHAKGLPAGVYPKGELPNDHPNGKCTFSVYMTQSTDEIVDSLLNWAHGGENEELDKFAESLGHKPSSFRKLVDKTRFVLLSEFIEKKINPSEWEDWSIDTSSFQEYLLNKKIPRRILDQSLDAEASANVQKVAQNIQVLASSTRQSQKVVYRGESYSSIEEVLKRYKPRSQIKNQQLTSFATSKDIAEVYAEGGFGGDIQVVLKLMTEKGTVGVMTDPLGVGGSEEIIAPIGRKYIVQSVEKVSATRVEVVLADYGDILTKKKAISELNKLLKK